MNLGIIRYVFRKSKFAVKFTVNTRTVNLSRSFKIYSFVFVFLCEIVVSSRVSFLQGLLFMLMLCGESQ